MLTDYVRFEPDDTLNNLSDWGNYNISTGRPDTLYEDLELEDLSVLGYWVKRH